MAPTALVAAVLLAVGAVAVLSPLALISLDAGFGIVFLGAALAGSLNLRAAWAWEGRERFAWAAAGAGSLFAGFGYLLGAGVEALTGEFPIWTNAAFISSYVVITAGTLALPYQRGTASARDDGPGQVPRPSLRSGRPAASNRPGGP